MEWIREKINVLEDKFGTNIKLRYIKYYKIYGTLEEQQARRTYTFRYPLARHVASIYYR